MDANQLEFSGLYSAFQPRIRRYLVHLVGETEAEDLAQEVFVKVHHALGGFRGEAQLSTWLYRIATHAAVDRLRHAATHEAPQADLANDGTQSGDEEVDDRDAWTGEEAPLLEQQVVRTEMSACIRRFVNKLPEDYRTVLVLSEVEGLKNKNIAEILGVSLATVKIRLHRARVKLKAELMANCDAYWAEQNEFVPDLRRASRILRRLGERERTTES